MFYLEFEHFQTAVFTDQKNWHGNAAHISNWRKGDWGSVGLVFHVYFIE